MIKFISLFVICFSLSTFSQEIKKVSGKKAIVGFSGNFSVSEGDLYLVESFVSGKKVARVKVLKVGSKSLLVQILKGRVSLGDQLVVETSGEASEVSSSPSKKSGNRKFGVLLGYHLFQTPGINYSGSNLGGENLGYEFDMQTAIGIKLQYALNPKYSLIGNIVMVDGEGTLANSTLNPKSSSFTNEAFEIHLGMQMYLNPMFYVSGTIGYATTEIASQTDLVDLVKMTGIPLTGGIGAQFGKNLFIFQVEGYVGWQYITSVDVTPNQIQIDSGSQLFYGLVGRVGLNF